MKNTKKLLLLVALMLGGFLFVNEVNASMAWILENPSLICNPQQLTPGTKTECYYFGTQKGSGSDYEANNTGFYFLMYTTENLVIRDIAPNNNIKSKVGAILVSNSGSDTTSIDQKPTSMPQALKDNFKCNIKDATEKSKNKNDAACGVLYTNDDQTQGAFNKDSLKIYGYLETHTNKVTELNIAPSNAVVLGTIELELPKSNVEGCGEICIASYGVAKKEDWGKGNCKNEDVTAWDGQSCEDADIISTTPAGVNKTMVDGDFNCYELTLKQVVPGNTPTGAFISYAILAAGALIAISAVTISKKHNKLQRI